MKLYTHKKFLSHFDRISVGQKTIHGKYARVEDILDFSDFLGVFFFLI